ncbi:MAG: SRPBCC family protein [Polyangiales bacterium]
MHTLHKSVLIQAPATQVFEYIDDPLTNPEWVVGLTEVTDTSGTGKGRRHRWKYKMVGIPFSGETVVTEHEPGKRLVLAAKGAGGESNWTFVLEEGEGETTLDVTVDYTIPVPVLGKFAEKFILKRNEREFELGLENIRERLEA